MGTVDWIYKNEIFVEEKIGDNCGFVYLITNNNNKKKYIGKKLFHFSKSKTVKGKKKRYKIQSDWKDYYGSNTKLQDDVKMHGVDSFKREILHLCKTKGQCNYLEAKEQFNLCVLENLDFYNDWIMVKVSRKHIGKLNDQ